MGPVLRRTRDVDPLDADLTIQHAGEPIGERITVTGRVLDGDGRPVRRSARRGLAGQRRRRYIHQRDQHPAPLDPNFTGIGRCLTDDDGGYRFMTIKPGPYPWRNHHNAWRPAHIHFSLFGTRLHPAAGDPDVLPGRPAVRPRPDLPVDRRPAARERLVAAYDHDAHRSPSGRTGYRWDIVLTGSAPTPLEEEE